MFLKIATVIAIIGVAFHLILQLIQQSLFYALGARFVSSGTQTVIRLLGAADLLLFSISLLIFFVAFLLSLRSRPIPVR